MNIKYGIIAINRQLVETSYKSPVYHFVGYENQPQFNDYISLYNELKIDEELGLCDIMDDLILIPASDEVVEDYKDVFAGIDENNDQSRYKTLVDIYNNRKT